MYKRQTREIEGNAEIASVTFPGFAAGLQPGDTVLIDDGSLRLQVESVTETDVCCKVLHGGRIADHKGINVPNVHMDIPALGSRDKEDLLFGIQNDVDFVAASFVRSKEDVVAIRRFLDYNGGHQIKIISKIENTEGIENFDAILDCSDGIMVDVYKRQAHHFQKGLNLAVGHGKASFQGPEGVC